MLCRKFCTYTESEFLLVLWMFFLLLLKEKKAAWNETCSCSLYQFKWMKATSASSSPNLVSCFFFFQMGIVITLLLEFEVNSCGECIYLQTGIGRLKVRSTRVLEKWNRKPILPVFYFWKENSSKEKELNGKINFFLEIYANLGGLLFKPKISGDKVRESGQNNH